MLVISWNIKIPLREFEFTFARSSGPGGQNVNKVNSKAILKWNVATCASLPDAVKQRFVETYPRRINEEGFVTISSERFRDQSKNQEDCIEKLKLLLLSIAQPPRDRIATKPTRASQLKKREFKDSHSSKKKLRQKPDHSLN